MMYASTGGTRCKERQEMLVCEQSGMNEAMADLYALTGKPEYRALAGRFNHRAVLDSPAQGPRRRPAVRAGGRNAPPGHRCLYGHFAEHLGC